MKPTVLNRLDNLRNMLDTRVEEYLTGERLYFSTTDTFYIFRQMAKLYNEMPGQEDTTSTYVSRADQSLYDVFLQEKITKNQYEANREPLIRLAERHDLELENFEKE